MSNDGPSLTLRLPAKHGPSMIFSSTHVYNSPSFEHLGDSSGSCRAVVHESEVGDTLDALLSEGGSVLVEVESSEPLVDAHVFELEVEVKQVGGVLDAVLGPVSELEEVALELGHGDDFVGELVGELLLLFLGGVGEEFVVHLL